MTMTMTTPTAAILLRVSTQRQAEDDRASYDVQRDACRTYAADRGFTVPDDLIWQEVGKRDQYYTRDGLQAALTAAEQGRYQALIVWRLDRLTDDIGNFLRILDRLKSHGALPWSATEPDVDLSTPDGLWYVHTKLHFQVKPERSTTATRTKEARRKYTEQGRAWASNRAPYGYVWVVDPQRVARHGDIVVPLKERCTPDPITAPVVVQIYVWVADGRTLQWVARALSGLEDGGIHKQPTPRQYSGMAGANPDGIWLESAIVKMLKNPAYKGKYATYRTKHVPRNDGSERYMQVPLPESEWVYVTPSPTPALVSPELWQRVQQRLAANKQYSDRNTSPDHRIGAEQALLFRGMARCSVCGGPMEVKSALSASADPSGVGTRVYHYRCTNNARNKGVCPGVGWKVHASDFDRAVWAALVAVLRSPDILARLARRSLAHDQALADGVTLVTPLDTYRALQKKLAAKEADLQNLVLRNAAIPAGDPALVGYDLAIGALGAEVATLRADVTRAKRDAARYERVEAVIGAWSDYLDMANDVTSMMATRSYSAANKRTWLEALGAKVIVQSQGADGPLAVLQLHLTALDSGSLFGPPAALAVSAAMPDDVPTLDVPVVALPAEPWRQGPPPHLPLATAILNHKAARDGGDSNSDSVAETGESSGVIGNSSCRGRRSL